MRVVFFVLLLTAGVFAHAQNDSAFACVRYTLTHIADSTWPENPVVSNHILYLGKKLSMYTDYDRDYRIKHPPTSSTNLPAGTMLISQLPADQREILSAGGNVFKEIGTGNLVSMELLVGKLFAVSEKASINWSIQPDTKEIMGLKCQKAIGEYKGRVYEAWFAGALPYSNGPWKLGGLPGLIMEATDIKKEVVFSFVSFENPEQKNDFGITGYAVKASPDEFKHYKESLLKNQRALIGSSGASTTVVASDRVDAAGNGTTPRKRRLNNPIEKDQQP